MNPLLDTVWERTISWAFFPLEIGQAMCVQRFIREPEQPRQVGEGHAGAVQ